ncbi:MAG: ABC transporter permease [Spirochaetales bacterium]
MKIFKLTRAEMQKIYAKPAIFIVAFILILVLAGSSFIYNVPNRDDGKVTLVGDTVGEIYSNYMNVTEVESKTSYDALLTSIENYVTNYSTPTTVLDQLETSYNLVDVAYSAYIVNINSAAPDATTDASKHALKTALQNFKSLYISVYGQPYKAILITSENHISMLQFLDVCLNTIVDDDDASNTTISNNLNSLTFLITIQDKLDQISPFIVSSTIINGLTDYYLPLVDARLAVIQDDIAYMNTSKATSTEETDLLDMNTLISKYKLTIKQFEAISYNSIYLNVFDGLTNDKVNTYTGFESLDLYQIQENLTKNLYLFDNSDFAYNYANVFELGTSSNTIANAYDFTYFTLELFSFIIIIFAVVLGAGMIAGEEASGTMKLLAIRPYKRYKILLAKIFATLRIAFMFILIGTMASFITGTYLFSSASLPILSVFNAELVMTMSPIILLAVYLVNLFIEVLFYIVVAVAISSIFKSNIGAVTISILIYFASIVTSFITGASWTKYIPLTNTNLFKYFGGAFNYTSNIMNWETILKNPLLPDTNFYFGLIVVGSTIAVLLIASLSVFSRRDLK